MKSPCSAKSKPNQTQKEGGKVSSRPSLAFSADGQSEEGFVLLLVLFIIALCTVLITDLASETLSYERSTRRYSEQIQGQLVLKSGINLAKLLLQAPKPEETKNIDWLYEAWHNIGSVPSIPLEGLIGELRLSIVDEDGKLDLNALANVRPQGAGPKPPPPGDDKAVLLDNGSYWRNTASILFNRLGFERVNYAASSFKTFGNVGYPASEQVAIIADWIDRDSLSFAQDNFEGKGQEASLDSAWFFNRPLISISELPNIPGLSLDRAQRLAPFVRVSELGAANSPRININTAPIEVLIAMGFTDTQAAAIVDQRAQLPYDQKSIANISAGDPNLSTRLKVNSEEFSALARVILPNRSLWARAILEVSGSSRSRLVTVKNLEYR